MSWVYGILCLIFLIIFHEFGHLIAAKICGVKVESFSVGFGPILLHKTIKGTDYRLSLIPLGGYCGLKGEKDFQKALDEKLPEITGEKDSLYGVHPLKRAFIGFNGPFFNIILAVIGFWLINLIGYNYQTFSNQILIPDSTTENVSNIAKEAGMLSGDKIIFINDKEVKNFDDIRTEIVQRPDEDLIIKVERKGEIIEIRLHSQLDKETGSGKIGIMADTSKIIEVHTPKYNIFTAFGKGIKDTGAMIGLTYKSIGILFKGVNLKNTVSGPLRTTDMLGSTIQTGFSIDAKTGFLSLFEFVALISVSLAIMNLLPIPVLDGGLILIAIIECIFRRKVKPSIQYYIQFIGLGFILILFIIGLYGDISYFIGK